MEDKKFVTYEEFGAVGDGVADDFAAIYKAHNYANENGLSVKVEGTPTYYIHDTIIDGKPATATIMTDVDWGDANIIIDDTDIGYSDPRSKQPIFSILADYKMFTINDPAVLSRLNGTGPGTKKLDIELGYSALVIPYDETQFVFNRFGASFAARGGQKSPAKELLLIDAEGNIDESTPFMFSYNEVCRLDVLRVDVKPITLKGGTITTKASRVNIFYTNDEGVRTNLWGYIKRNLLINRSFTTVENVKHYVVGEYDVNEEKAGFATACYSGFFMPTFANEIVLKDCVLTARRAYKRPQEINGTGGTYDFSANAVNKIILINCVQSNFYVDTMTGCAPTADSKPENIVLSTADSKVTGSLMRWGIGGTNFCKNMEYHGCTLSRFDAHEGLYNGKIINCKINAIALTGTGDVLIENTHWIGAGPGRVKNSMVYLRNDYGSTWNGTITIKDCTATANRGDMCLVQHTYENWYFGHKCYYPNVIIDNLTIENLDEDADVYFTTEHRCVLKEPAMHLPTVLKIPNRKPDGTSDMENLNQTTPPKFIKVINNKQGNKILLSRNIPFFENTEISGFEIVDRTKEVFV